jgi:DNA-binding cell septation regulator SpoVG
MLDITVFNFTLVGKGVLKATVSVNLGNGIIIHECKIILKDDNLRAFQPQRLERAKGGISIYHNLIEFEDERVWDDIESQILAYYHSQAES